MYTHEVESFNAKMFSIHCCSYKRNLMESCEQFLNLSQKNVIVDTA